MDNKQFTQNTVNKVTTFADILLPIMKHPAISIIILSLLFNKFFHKSITQSLMFSVLIVFSLYIYSMYYLTTIVIDLGRLAIQDADTHGDGVVQVEKQNQQPPPAQFIHRNY
jgi:hypothetical protein